MVEILQESIKKPYGRKKEGENEFKVLMAIMNASIRGKDSHTLKGLAVRDIKRIVGITQPHDALKSLRGLKLIEPIGKKKDTRYVMKGKWQTEETLKKIYQEYGTKAFNPELTKYFSTTYNTDNGNEFAHEGMSACIELSTRDIDINDPQIRNEWFERIAEIINLSVRKALTDDRTHTYKTDNIRDFHMHSIFLLKAIQKAPRVPQKDKKIATLMGEMLALGEKKNNFRA